MTHGEETGPETHQDSAVLTYLEGLLMHRVAGAQSATATQQSEAEKGNEEQRNKETPGLLLPKHSSQQEQDKTTPQGGSTHHVKKARLLRSEVWTEHENQVRQMSMPSPELNGKKQEHCGGLNGSLQCKGESTLLASLLQNFSTRLQNVALSQQIEQNLAPQKASSSSSKPNKEDNIPEHGSGSDGSGLCLAGNSTMQNNTSSQIYHHRQPSKERLSKSPGALQRSALSSSSESLHCTERLKAVASLVNIRSSPAPSPKPSVACSQLALLLSSEAHLQQYSREHALKAQLAGRSASERLAIIATQQTQEKNQPTISQTNHDGLTSLHTKNGIPSQMPTSSSRQSQSLHTGQSRSVGSVRRTHPFRERRPFERHGRPSQNCSSLLLQLLNSHNTPQRLNSQDHLKEDANIFSSQGSPMFSDSEQSNSISLPKDSSDAESTRSSCSPIDLSLKNKLNNSTPFSSSFSPSLDKVTESLKTRWTESPASKFLTEPKELYTCSEIKPHHKVTLLELLLDQKHMEKTTKAPENTDLQPKVQPKVSSASTSNHSLFYPSQCKDTVEPSPNSRSNTRSPKLLPTFSQGRDCNVRASPYKVYSSPHTQSVPLDLCKNKPLASSPSVKEASFSASKLLQNLAQCGKKSAASSPTPKAPLPPVKRQTEEFRTSKSSTLLEKLAVPVQKNNTPHAKSVNSLVAESAQHNSEIENLLERRTVLQLLLGNTSQKERVGNKRKGESGKQENSKSHNTLDRPPTDLAVKTEPVENEMCNDEKASNQWQNKLAESRRQSPHTLNQGSIKQEPVSPMAVPGDGLLCHLLHQKPRKLKPNFLEHSNQGCIKEEPVEHHHGPTIPKKRKFSVDSEDHIKVTQQRLCHSSGSLKEDSNCSTSGIPESQGSSGPSSPPQADSPPAKFPPCESPRNENGGFNVLKQLLLSDNCLKELSQSRAPFSSLERPVQNGSTIKEPRNNGEHQSFQQVLNQGKQTSSSVGTNRLESLTDVQQDSSRTKRDVLSRRDLKSSTGFVNGDKTQDCRLDSPRLTKANPILYYMLQRSNAHLVRDRVELEAKSGPCRVQTKERDESEAFDLNVHLQQNPHHNGTHSCDSPRINGSLKKS